MNVRVVYAACIAGLLVVTVLSTGCSSRGTYQPQYYAARPAYVQPAPAQPTPAPRVVTRPTPPRMVAPPQPAPSRTAVPQPPVVRRSTEIPQARPTQPSRPSKSHRNTSLRYGRPGFAVYEVDGRLWVFRSGSESLREYLTKGEPAKRITRIGVGPDDKTVVSDEGSTIDGYLAATRYAASGYHVEMKDGRLWVFANGSQDLVDYRKHGEPAKRITRIGAGPDGKTVIGPDAETLDGYLAKTRYGVSGFETFLVDGRIWVFRKGSKDLAEYKKSGEPAKRVTLIGAGPDDKTVIGPDRETLNAYVSAVR